MNLALVNRWFVALWRERPGSLAAIIVMSVVNALLVTAFPWLWQYLVDQLETPGTAPADIAHVGAWLLVIGLGQAGLYVVLQTLRTVMNAWIQRRTRTRVFDHLTDLPDAFFARWRSGDLVTRLTDDGGEKTSWFLCSGVFRALEAALIVVVSLGAMLWVDWRLTAWVVLPLPVLLGAQAAAQELLGRQYGAVQAAISGINDELATTFGGIRIVQACGLAPAARARFVAQAERQQAAEIAVARVNQAVYLMYGHGWQVAMGVLLLVGGPRVIAHEITLGQFVAFEGLVMTLVWPMFDVGMFVSRYMQAGVALGRLQALLDEPAAPRPAGPVPADARLKVEGAAVTVGADSLLSDVELDLRPGELVAVVGEVGAGKSTLMRLLAGAMPPVRGQVTIGGLPTADADTAAVRQLLAYVPQDPVILSVPLRDNILLGRVVSSERLDRALRVSRLAQDLPAFPHGLDTMVGERGVTLSGGQQQRVALARALVGDPRILLLDDATAALDADTEAAFWAELDAVLPDVTAVVVTHRPATIERAHRVVCLEGGRIVQEGPHRRLIDEDGPYRRIYGRFSVASAPA